MKSNSEILDMLNDLQTNAEDHLKKMSEMALNYANQAESSALSLLEQTSSTINDIKDEANNINFNIHNALIQFPNKINSVKTYVIDSTKIIANKIIELSKQAAHNVVENTKYYANAAKEETVKLTNQTLDKSSATINKWKDWVQDSKKAAINWIQINANEFAEKYLEIEEGKKKFYTDVEHLKLLYTHLAEKANECISSTKHFIDVAKNAVASFLNQIIEQGKALGYNAQQWAVESKDAILGYATDAKDDIKQFTSDSYNSISKYAAHSYEAGKYYFNQLVSKLSPSQPAGLVESQIKANFTDTSETGKSHERAGTKLYAEETINDFASEILPKNVTINSSSTAFLFNSNQPDSIFGLEKKFYTKELVAKESPTMDLKLDSNNFALNDANNSEIVTSIY